VVMKLKGVGPAGARRLLAASGGFVRRAVGAKGGKGASRR
jgi:hypothetical protein